MKKEEVFKVEEYCKKNNMKLEFVNNFPYATDEGGNAISYEEIVELEEKGGRMKRGEMMEKLINLYSDEVDCEECFANKGCPYIEGHIEKFNKTECTNHIKVTLVFAEK